MIIRTFDISSPFAPIDTFDLTGVYGSSTLSDFCYGISVDTDTKAYGVDSDSHFLVRMDKITLLGDLLVGSPGSGVNEFFSPTFSAIIEYVAAPVATANTFGNIIW